MHAHVQRSRQGRCPGTTWIKRRKVASALVLSLIIAMCVATLAVRAFREGASSTTPCSAGPGCHQAGVNFATKVSKAEGGARSTSPAAWCEQARKAGRANGVPTHAPSGGAGRQQWLAGCESATPGFGSAPTYSARQYTSTEQYEAGYIYGGTAGADEQSCVLAEQGESTDPSAPPNEPDAPLGTLAATEWIDGCMAGSSSVQQAEAQDTYQSGWKAAQKATYASIQAAVIQAQDQVPGAQEADNDWCIANDPTPDDTGGNTADGSFTSGDSSQWYQGCMGELQAKPPKPSVAGPSTPGYSVGYSLGAKEEPDLAAFNLTSPVTVSDARSWCDEYADPDYTYAPDGGQDTNPDDDPAVVGCIAGMKSKGAG